MTLKTLRIALLTSTLLAGAAQAQDVTLTIESWRNDDLTIWQDTIIPAFEAKNPGIKVVFAPSAPAEYNAVAELQARRRVGGRSDHLPPLRRLAGALQQGQAGRPVGPGRDGELLAGGEIRLADR